jgi:alpha-amylase
VRFGLKILSILAASSLLAGCVSSSPEASPEAAPPTPERFENQVGVQLFMWNWNSIAAECEFLGNAGIDWVVTSPPQEHIAGGAWWTVYQPVSYQIQGRLGSREEFANMTEVCAGHGVDIIADAVINHMTGQDSGVGSAGTEFTKYEYPGLYTRDDFHRCFETPNGQIQDYKDLTQVQKCELLGLSDLDTKSDKVQQTILGYLNDLLSLGVAGFRIDAAKHMFAPDLKEIIDQLPEGTRVIHEVIRGGGEPVQPEQYLDSGDVWEFDYARNMRSYFKREVITPAASRARFLRFTPSEQTVSFVSNHDTERNGETLNYNDARYFELATAMMLAEDYGQPMLYSSYAFTSYDAGPYELVDGVVDVDCSGVSEPKSEYKDYEWICQHRWSSTLNMIGFRDRAQDAPIVEKHVERGVYGFAREGVGYFITNVFDTQEMPVSVQTTLPDGEYVDLIDGASYQIVGGMLTTTLQPMSAIALLVD